MEDSENFCGKEKKLIAVVLTPPMSAHQRKMSVGDGGTSASVLLTVYTRLHERLASAINTKLKLFEKDTQRKTVCISHI